MRREDGVKMTATAGRNLLFYAQKKGCCIVQQPFLYGGKLIEFRLQDVLMLGRGKGKQGNVKK